MPRAACVCACTRSGVWLNRNCCDHDALLSNFVVRQVDLLDQGSCRNCMRRALSYRWNLSWPVILYTNVNSMSDTQAARAQH